MTAEAAELPKASRATSGRLSEDERDQTFLRHLFNTADYFAAVRAAGDLAWFEVGHPRRTEVIDQLGLADDIEETELRRALFARRYETTQRGDTE